MPPALDHGLRVDWTRFGRRVTLYGRGVHRDARRLRFLAPGRAQRRRARCHPWPCGIERGDFSRLALVVPRSLITASICTRRLEK